MKKIAAVCQIWCVFTAVWDMWIGRYVEMQTAGHIEASFLFLLDKMLSSILVQSVRRFKKSKGTYT